MCTQHVNESGWCYLTASALILVGGHRIVPAAGAIYQPIPVEHPPMDGLVVGWIAAAGAAARLSRPAGPLVPFLENEPSVD